MEVLPYKYLVELLFFIRIHLVDLCPLWRTIPISCMKNKPFRGPPESFFAAPTRKLFSCKKLSGEPLNDLFFMQIIGIVRHSGQSSTQLILIKKVTQQGIYRAKHASFVLQHVQVKIIMPIPQGSRKKSVFLVVGPLRPLPPPLGLSGHRTFFVML